MLLTVTIQRNQLRGKHETLLSTNEFLPYILSIMPVVLTPEFNTIHPISNGLKDFEYRITVVMNPLCSHCGKVHESLSKVEDCCIDYLIIVDEKDKNALHAAKQFITLSLSENRGWEKANAAMNLWYTKGRLEHIEESADTIKILKAQNAYCNKIRVSTTPTVFINGRRLPEIYDIDDLEYIL